MEKEINKEVWINKDEREKIWEKQLVDNVYFQIKKKSKREYLI